MSMPRLRWPLLAAFSLGLLPLPPASPPATTVQRLVLTPDSAFHLPDSVRAYLTAVTRMVVAPDSSLYLSDWQFPAILHLEPDGDLRGTLGRSGAGPGEFGQVFSLGTYRDSLWAMDPAQVRLTLFPLEGSGAAVTLPFGPYAPPSTLPGPISRRGAPVSMLPDGSILVEEGTPDPTRPTNGYLFRVDRSMHIIDTVAPLSAVHSNLVFVYREGEMHLTQPFADDPIYNSSADGSLLVLVSRTAATNEEGATFTVTGLRGASQVAFTREIPYTPRRLTKRMVDSVVTAIGGPRRPGTPRTPVTEDSIRARLYRPGFLPPVTSARVGRDGTVWLKVQLADSPRGMDEWMQLSPRGFPLRRVSTPAGFRILESDRRAVWGTYADSLDVPLVGRYPLTRKIN